MNIRDFTTIAERKNALEKEIGHTLPHIGTYSLDTEIASTKNCENMIGVVQVPLGVAGPLSVKTDTSEKQYYLPLATTEGALVASVSRGCKAIAHSNGAQVVTKRIGITRAPVFAVAGIAQGQKLISWVTDHFKEIKKIAEATSSHCNLLDITPWMMGKNVFLRFRYDSQDAMGMNMATIATSAASDFIVHHTQAKLIALSGNMCVDKKPSALNTLLGRGISVWAEVHLSHDTLKTVLKTTAEKFYETAQRKLVYGSQLAQTLGANSHIANIIAALFLATGQDVAHVAECSIGITTVEQEKEGIYIAVYLPDVVVGTVGGGTGLATQSEALKILGITGGNQGKHATQLTEVIGAACLAGEISLLASLSEDTLAKAHATLGRGKK